MVKLKYESNAFFILLYDRMSVHYLLLCTLVYQNFSCIISIVYSPELNFINRN